MTLKFKIISHQETNPVVALRLATLLRVYGLHHTEKLTDADLIIGLNNNQKAEVTANAETVPPTMQEACRLIGTGVLMLDSVRQFDEQLFGKRKPSRRIDA